MPFTINETLVFTSISVLDSFLTVREGVVSHSEKLRWMYPYPEASAGIVV